MNAPLQTTSRIRELNDMFRTCFIGGRVLITEGITDPVNFARIIGPEDDD